MEKSDKENEKNMDLGERMKEYEAQSLEIVKIDPTRPYIVRLDGRGFSKFTSGLRKPFDMNFTKAMVLTTSDLVKEFTASTGYTHSDEITIIFKEATTQEDIQAGKTFPHMFAGRVMKILTVMAGYCSVRFNYHLIKIVNTEENISHYQEQYIEKINSMKASFDARLILVPENNLGEIVNHMIWRSLHDCERNAVSTYARSKFSQKQIHGKNKAEMIEMLKEQGINWETDVPFILKHGLYLKKENYEVELIEGDKTVNCVRTKVTGKTFKIQCNDFFTKTVLDKVWEVSEEDAKKYEVTNFDMESGFK